jgi:large subunit ribosomal protein L21
MYAIMETGGKQYRVAPGQVVRVEKIDAEVGQAVDFDKVLLIVGDSGVSVGKPTVPGASVHASVLAQARAKKILVFKYKPKKRIRTKTGHRQPFTSVRIESIVTA